MSSRYTKVEPKGPSEDSLLLKEAIESIPSVDNTSLEEKLTLLTEELKRASSERQEAHRASQELYQETLNKIIVSLDSIAKTSQTAPQEVVEPPPPLDVEALVKGMAEIIPAPSVAPDPVDVQGLVEKVFNLTNNKPTYTFEVKRDASGRLKEIVANPSI